MFSNAEMVSPIQNPPYTVPLFAFICRKAGIKKHITIHGLRPTHAVLLLESGAILKDVQDRLGHKSIQTTADVNAHVSKKLEEKSVDGYSNYMDYAHMKRKKDMMQKAKAIIIQSVKDERSGKAPVKESKNCSAIKTTSSFLKQNIKNNKRKAVAQFSHLDNSLDNSIKQVNFVAHRVPDVFSNLVGS
ncbi:tyrosine-type recombinase/integrase, partial [Peribacillus sp. CSMR9]|uniref:tyrosine-type recombinase/integrase n=1 Tax=Peribacillus sp. CSMR9 TaxID=2981350 RepID=UPI00295430A8